MTATLAALPDPPTIPPRRVPILIEIAERYRELVEPLNGPSGVRGDGDAPMIGRHDRRCQVARTLRCTCSYRSVHEFERLAVRLRDERHHLWWHLNAYWLEAESRTINWCPRCHRETHDFEHVHARKDGTRFTVQTRRRVIWQRHRNADRDKARKAVEQLAGWWALESEPMLPDEYRVAA